MSDVMFPLGRSSIFIIPYLKVMTVHVMPLSSAHSDWLLLMLSGWPVKYEDGSFDAEV